MTSSGQEPTTGSRTSGAGIPRQVIYLNPPHEVQVILQLLQRNEVEEAYRKAVNYVHYTENSNLDTPSRYYAYNALCAVLTKQGKYDEALENCDVAVKLHPGFWSALNNRGTIYYLTGEYDAALTDYSMAKDVLSSGREDQIDAINHNINLVRQRME